MLEIYILNKKLDIVGVIIIYFEIQNAVVPFGSNSKRIKPNHEPINFLQWSQMISF